MSASSREAYRRVAHASPEARDCRAGFPELVPGCASEQVEPVVHRLVHQKFFRNLRKGLTREVCLARKDFAAYFFRLQKAAEGRDSGEQPLALQ